VNLERTNVADAARSVRDVEIDVVTLDLSYLSIARAVRYLEGVRYRRRADLIALVKPMYELGLAAPPDDEPTLRRALAHAIAGVDAGSWRVCESIRSPVLGSRGTIEWLVHARRRRPHRTEQTAT
jgi:predicted rRNA methylase YqxC with S4 and FtsJ domains